MYSMMPVHQMYPLLVGKRKQNVIYIYILNIGIWACIIYGFYDHYVIVLTNFFGAVTVIDA